jgi:hypothetical protein
MTLPRHELVVIYKGFLCSILKRKEKGFKNASLYPIKKGKAIPLPAWTGPGGSRRLRLPDFKTIAT